jgi:Cdc6-like AAA superfamily ATPase
LERFLDGKPLILVLDEIDKPTAKARDAIIYSFSEIPNVSLICICNSRYFFFTLDSRSQSRLSPVLIEFPRYTQEQIYRIIEDRSELALKSESATKGLLRKISRISFGDARIAIQTLRSAAQLSEQQSKTKIEIGNLSQGNDQARDVKRKYLLGKLSEHHQILLKIIRDKREIRSSRLRKSYLQLTEKNGIEPLAERTFNLYLKQLRELGFVDYRRALGIRGNVRIYKVK